jgi:hypothetical protein
MVEYTEVEKQEIVDKYSWLHREVLITDKQLSIAQLREHDMLKAAIEHRDKTIGLVEKSGFKWRIKSEQEPRTGKSIAFLEIWNPDIHFGFNFILEGSWYD